MLKDRFHIFFHSDDVDGIVSAALILYFIVRNKLYILYPVTSSQRGKKFKTMVSKVRKAYPKDAIIIVDYQYHKEADLWVDHHFDNDLKSNIVSNDRIDYNSQMKSAARIIYNRISKSTFNNHLLVDPHIIDTVDMIDSAGYESIDYIFTSVDSLMLLKAYLEQLTVFVDSTPCRIVETISASDFHIGKTLFKLNIDNSIIDSLKKKALLVKDVMVVNNSYISITEMNRLYAYPRYSEYFAQPDLKYSIRIVHLGGGRIQADVGFNQWQSFTHMKLGSDNCFVNSIHIGKLLGNLDYLVSGGGHKDVGGAIMVKNQLEQFLDDVTTKLNNGDCMNEEMEKVAVDKEDDVEKDAQQMVKTGNVADIDQARKKASDKAIEPNKKAADV